MNDITITLASDAGIQVDHAKLDKEIGEILSFEKSLAEVKKLLEKPLGFATGKINLFHIVFFRKLPIGRLDGRMVYGARLHARSYSAIGDSVPGSGSDSKVAHDSIKPAGLVRRGVAKFV